jgi:hypothetical protein
MELKVVMLSEISQTQKDKHFIFLSYTESRKKDHKGGLLRRRRVVVGEGGIRKGNESEYD